MCNPSDRSKPRLKPRFPRLQRLMRKRRAEQTDWYTTADEEGNVVIHPRSEHVQPGTPAHDA